jgi:hypothetical protein
VKKNLLCAALTCLVMSVTACATLSTNLASSTPAQVTTLDDAEKATKLVANGADTIVNTVAISKANLLKGLALSNAVSAALAPLETAASNGQSLDFTALNAALGAFQAFQATLATSGASAPAAASSAASN